MYYQHLCKIYQELESTTKRLEKTRILADFFKTILTKELGNITYLLQGRVFPAWAERKLGFSSQLMLKAITQSTGITKSQVISLWKKTGDLGLVAEELIKRKKQTTLSREKLTVDKVFNNITKLASLEGPGTVSRKVSLVSELLSNSSPIEAKFVTRTVLEDLRVGVAEGILRDSISRAYNVPVQDVERAYDILVDYWLVAEKAKQGKHELTKTTITVGKPFKVMLAIKVDSINEAFKALGKKAQFEYKLDGFRATIHKKGNNISLFTRRLENVTNQFKEILPLIKKQIKGNSLILDAELVGYEPKTKKYLPFQNISQRIKRKYNIEQIAKKFPVEVNIFDIVYYNGKSLFNKPLLERRKLLEKILKSTKRKIVLTKKIITDNEKKANDFFKSALKAGTEGVMIKNINSIYRPGRRVNGWCKYKSELEPLDLVITKAEWGHGKRANWLTSFTVACKSKDKLLEVGKVSTGVKEKAVGLTYKKMTKLLSPLSLDKKGRVTKVKPIIVIEVGYEEIQKSPTYTSGYALRFPRVLRYRPDKPVSEIVTIKEVEKVYSTQKHNNK